MYLKYGNFQFEPWEATFSNISIQTLYSPRRYKLTQIVQMMCVGDVVGDASACTTRLADIRAALSVDDQDFGLYDDSNNPTEHYLESSATNALNLTGNQVFFRSFPSDAGAEYVSGRQFAFGIKAEIDAAETSLLEYRETYRAIGDCGAINRWRETPAGIIVEQLAPSSIQRVIHSGYAKTLSGWFVPPAPFYDRPFYMGDSRDIAYTTPEDRYPRGLVGYRTDWTYRYELPLDIYNTPTIR